MSWKRSLLCGSLAVMFAAAAIATEAQSAPDPALLKHTRLVIWVVHPVGTLALNAYGSAARSAPGYSEQTSGSFGQTASTYGSTSSNVGMATDSPLILRETAEARVQAAQNKEGASPVYREQTAGDFGQTAGSVGTDASNHGQSPSTVGQNAGNVGMTAGNYGQTAGSYGNSLSTLDQAGQPLVREMPAGLVQVVSAKFAAAYPNSRLNFVTMNIDKVAAALRANANSSTQYPDVLVFENFPSFWIGPSLDLQRAAAIQIAPSPLTPRSTNLPLGALSARVCVVLPHSRHRNEAEAFQEFLQNEGALKAPVTTR